MLMRNLPKADKANCDDDFDRIILIECINNSALQYCKILLHSFVKTEIYSFDIDWLQCESQ